MTDLAPADRGSVMSDSNWQPTQVSHQPTEFVEANRLTYEHWKISKYESL